MRFLFDDSMFRVFGKGGEIAYAKFALRGPELEVETPSDWHEQRRAWLRIGLVFVTIAVSVPWKWVVPDEHQCSGPRYGFKFFGDALWIYYGKDSGRSDQRRYARLAYPWAWEHVRHSYLNPDGSLHHHAQRHEYSAPDDSKRVFPYRYVLRDGEVQERTATVNGEEREWRWRWFQWLAWPRMVRRSINIDFSDEVGEKTGSWKGGTTGCGYDWKHGETMEQSLRRMERERRFT